MFSQLPACSVSAVLSVMIPHIPVAGMVLVELFRAIRAFEFVAFAGHTHQRDGHQ